MSFSDCLRKGLVFKAAIDSDRIAGELEIAEKFLSKARGLLEPDYYDVSFLMSYTSMFHSARSLLFGKGYSERSHACLVVALKELFKTDDKLRGLLDALDAYRLARQLVQYSGESCSKTDAEQAVVDAEKLLAFARRRP